MQTERTSIPKHIVLFPDGNRRWAKAHGVASLQGHLAGKENFQGFLTWCKEAGVQVMTVFGFSTENWNRSPEEVAYLMQLFETYLADHASIEHFQREGVRVRVIGQKERLSQSLQQVVSHIEDVTRNNTAFHVNLAVSYGGKWDIAEAVRKLVGAGVKAEDITEDLIEQHLSTAGLPAPDLVIRAGGEQRLSNFVLWQSAYAELYFTPILWPDFTKQDLDEVLAEYARRQRRFGT